MKMYNNLDGGIPMEKLAMQNEGYNNAVVMDDYLNPAGEGSGGQVKHETSLTDLQEESVVVKNGRPGIRPKNSRFDSGWSISVNFSDTSLAYII